jgi:hypothetical protein
VQELRTVYLNIKRESLYHFKFATKGNRRIATYFLIRVSNISLMLDEENNLSPNSAEDYRI